LIYNLVVKTDFNTSSAFTQAGTQSVPARNSVAKKDSAVTQPKPASHSSADYLVDLGPRPSVPMAEVSVPKMEESIGKKVELQVKQEVIKAVMPEVKAGSMKKDAIIFIKGLDLFSSPSKSEGGYAGVGRMAESIEGARIYGWNQKDEIIKEVLKIHPENKIVLVGHSLGGDTAVEVSEALDSLKNNFRSVDLLITMDAVGFGNDIIPQNVKRHLNIFGENDLFLNDGPHAAREADKTKVTNILSPLDHVDIDDDKETHREVISLIRETLLGVS
jgi:hypothetical protein